MHRNKNVTAKLAEFCSGLTLGDIPNDVIRRIQLLTLDQVGAILLGSLHNTSRITRAYADEQSSIGRCTVAGGDRLLRAEWAGFVNGTSGQGLEIDDYHASALIHPGSVAVPAVLAMGEENSTDGEDLLVALTVGFEVQLRIAVAAQPGLSPGRGFQPTSAVGVFGAAAAAGKLLAQEVPTLMSSFGIAGTHSCGLLEYTQSGGEVKRIHAGLAVAGGIRSAKLAHLGLTGPGTVIEGSRGFLQAFSDGADPHKVLDGLGDRWETMSVGIKQYACNGHLQAPVDALQSLIETEGLNASNVEEIVVGLAAMGVFAVGSIGPSPKELVQAQFSAHYTLALRLVEGGNDYSHYQKAEEVGFDLPGVLAVANRVRVQLDAEADAAFPGTFMTVVRVRKTDGSTVERRMVASGFSNSRLTDDVITQKYMRLAEPVIGRSGAQETMSAIDNLRGGGSATEIAKWLSRGRSVV